MEPRLEIPEELWKTQIFPSLLDTYEIKLVMTSCLLIVNFGVFAQLKIYIKCPKLEGIIGTIDIWNKGNSFHKDNRNFHPKGVEVGDKLYMKDKHLIECLYKIYDELGLVWDYKDINPCCDRIKKISNRIVVDKSSYIDSDRL